MRRRKRRRLKWRNIIRLFLFIFLIVGGIYGFTVYKSFNSAVATMHEPLDDKQNSEKQPKALKKKEPFSVLMLGVDEREGDSGRSDTMIVLTVNPNNNSVKMLSIPRDTMTEIVGKGKEDKINHAYAFGGVPMAVDTVENFLDIPIDYYVKINMEGFKDIIDTVGGINVENDLAFKIEGINFPAGKIHLDGEEALAFIRMRYDDPDGDFGRQERQRQVIQAVIKEGTSITSLSKAPDIFQAIGSNIKTNLTFEEMISIQKNYKEAGKNIKQLTIISEGKMIDNIYYGIVTIAEQQRIQDELQAQLEMNSES
ncbi:LytR family transcriptional regulator [Neobacillus sp. 179-C4.2 HS]|uniref:Polyisoprenyl-teichoic acid--peptidoglycan teichoic acid transferase TagU n=1 Tax=Neobacillus driksii TaxID=3035913 RepID=A0ABV4Z040_9BACI|nr:LytR family transcriptional regulator [Neobacillus sp. 179.-C4.2 HS]MDP5197284.1 LytR family transcriptional regulator [Neobacillus sp. 179.-C4.2 HS]